MLAPSKLFREGDEDGGEGHGDVRVAADEGERSILGGLAGSFLKNRVCFDCGVPLLNTICISS